VGAAILRPTSVQSVTALLSKAALVRGGSGRADEFPETAGAPAGADWLGAINVAPNPNTHNAGIQRIVTV